MARTNRRSLARGRKDANRPKRRRHLIVSNGKVTELEYFNLLIEEANARGNVQFRFIDGDPLTVVKQLKRRLKLERSDALSGEIDGFSSVWIVVDADDFRNLEEANREANNDDYRLAISNPCFEVWLIDHVLTCPDSCSSSVQCERKARELGLLNSTSSKRNSASKFKSVNRGMIQGHIADALVHAQKHNTEVKRRTRISTPNKVDSYQVWTDVPDLIREVFSSSI